MVFGVALFALALAKKPQKPSCDVGFGASNEPSPFSSRRALAGTDVMVPAAGWVDCAHDVADTLKRTRQMIERIRRPYRHPDIRRKISAP